MKTSGNIISLAGLKADYKTVKTCPSASLVDIGDDVFCLEFHTKMNAINGEIVDFMAEGLDYVDANGAGLEQLRSAGIEVQTGACETEARLLNAPFMKFAATGKCWVILKWAQSIDGKVAWTDQPPGRQGPQPPYR